MRDLKYSEAAGTLPAWKSQMKAIAATRSPALHPIGKAFVTNLTRMSSLAVMPIEIAYRAKRDQRIEDYLALKAKLEVPPLLHAGAANIEALQTEAVNYVEHLIHSSKGMLQSLEAVLASLITRSST